MDAAKAELEKRGVKFAEEIRPAAGGGRVLFFEDGEGNLLHLVERPADSTLREMNYFFGTRTVRMGIEVLCRTSVMVLP